MLWKEIVAEPAASRLGAVGRIAVMLILFGILAPTAWMFFTTITPHIWTFRLLGLFAV